MKEVPVVSVADHAEGAARLAGLGLEATVALAEVAAAVKDGLLAFASAAGLVVMAQMMEAELTERIGPQHAKIPGCSASWHGSTPGSVVLGGRKVPMRRPRGRTSEGEEVKLDTWAVFSAEDLLRRLVVERMLAGVATRRCEAVAEPVGTELEKAAKATSKSAISRRFVKATEQALAELNARDLSSLEVAVVMVDGIELAGQCCVVCLVITADGTKVPVGLWLGSTENRTVVTGLLAELQARGLSTTGVLVVIDGSKVLAAGVRRVFGEDAEVQRCTLHKQRNVSDHLPQDLQRTIDRRLAGAFAHTEWTTRLERAKATARELNADHPDAAASLLEGPEDMFTVRQTVPTPDSVRWATRRTA
jgi:putative transposase